MNKIKGIVVLSLMLLSFLKTAGAYTLSEKADGRVEGVRVSDVVKYLGNITPDLANIDIALRKSPEQFTTAGAPKELLNLYFRSLPETRDGLIVLPLTAVTLLSDNRVIFENFNVITTGSAKSYSVEKLKAIALTETNLKVEVGLVERKAIVKDASKNIKMVFPLGVGSFDLGILHDSVSLLTPRFQEGYLDKRTLIKERTKPRYFAGKPFIRLTTDKTPSKGHTGIGFHAQPNLDTFIRAFDSHGCMRMQLSDLNLMYYLVASGPRQHVPITVLFHLEDESEHPHPKTNKSYKRVVNVGSKENPRYDIDRDGLVLVGYAKGDVPLEGLVDDPRDQYHTLFNYDLDWREQDRIRKHNEACRAQFGNSGSKYRKCVKDGERKLDVGDRLYRFWVHG